MNRTLSPFLIPLALGVAAPLSWAATGSAPLALAPGDLEAKPGGGFYLVDPNLGGGAAEVGVTRLFWGRLVDVHDVDTAGNINPIPIFRDFVINENVLGDGVNYLLQSNPVTQKTRLIILATFQPPGSGGADPFLDLLNQAAENLPEILPKSDDPAELPPFSLLPRNAALVVQLDDLLADGGTAELQLENHVQMRTGYSPTVPYGAKRVFFDDNHGGVASREFHSTRVIVDLTVSELEASTMGVPTPVNQLGLPSSDLGVSAANVSVRIPTQVDFASGQFSTLTNTSGNPVSTSSGPFDPSVPTQDVVRAMRSGNVEDPNRGFLLDLEAPRILGQWSANVDAAADDPSGAAGVDFLVDLTFATDCKAAPAVGDVLAVAGLFVEVTAAGPSPDAAGKVSGVEVRSLAESTVAASSLLGPGVYVLPFQKALLPGSLQSCWLNFVPQVGATPGTSVDPSSQLVLRFSEPMDPETVSAFDSFAISRVSGPPAAHDIVVAEVVPSPDLTVFASTPVLPFAHEQGTAEVYNVWFGGRSNSYEDLAGNPVLAKPRFVPFEIDADAGSEQNGGIVLRFSSTDEVKVPAQADGAPDIRGQFLYDTENGAIQARPVTRFSAIADRTQAVPGIMIPFAPGIQSPLSPLGSKLQSVWRYMDVGFTATDESGHNVDVEGLAWSPIGAQVVADFYPEFEMRLAHSNQLPDEYLDKTSLLPTKPVSGLTEASFDGNILDDPESPQDVVHAKALGYMLDPLDLFFAPTGTPMLPWPMNTQGGGEYSSYTWRDTAVQAEGGPNSNGIDPLIMEDAGLIPADTGGDLAMSGQVPSIGLPLLMEFRCFPSDTSVGLNRFDISLALNTSRLPAFRVFSTGGIDTSGNPVLVDPDLAATPSGGFNPNSSPPGAPTPPDDPAFYIGQMDVVTRISRAHTIWLDTQTAGGTTSFAQPVVQQQLPAGTEIVLAWRGATDIGGQSGAGASGFAFDADRIDPYGTVRQGTEAEYLGDDDDVTFIFPGDDSWFDDLSALDGSRYVQARITFVGNVDTLGIAKLGGLGVAFTN
ncbi:MAG: hypothetical protein AAF682_26910 [Planctomycetota bacterium]